MKGSIMNALTKKILVVDDDPVVGKSFNRVLSNKGYAVITAENAREALSKMETADYDVVFTDIQLPGLDGVALAEKVKARHPWTPVVIVTGYGTAKNEARARAAGVAAFLHKPLSPEVIEETTATALVEAAPAAPAATPAAAPAVAPAPAEAAGEMGTLRYVATLLAAPFIGLAYVVIGPFVGLGYLAVMAARGLARLPMVRTPLAFLKDVGLFVAAPFIGLLYVIAFPFVGATILLWTVVRPKEKAPATE
jgi:CheY-like chemotaxis protein